MKFRKADAMRTPSFKSSCYGKQRYGDRRTAKAAVRALAGKGREGLSAYRCWYCEGWHVGH